MALVVMALVFAGWSALYSASNYSEANYFTKQVTAFFVGAVVAAVIVVIDYRFVVIFAPGMYAISVALLAAVLSQCVWTDVLSRHAIHASAWLAAGVQVLTFVVARLVAPQQIIAACRR